MAGFAGRDLATRAAPPAMSSAQLGTLGFAVVVTAGLALSLLGGAPTLPPVHALASVGGAAGFGVAAYLALTLAMRTGEVSVVTPFRYTRLVFAVIIGVVIFAERPDAMTLAGAALIAGSGIYTLLRSRRRGTRH